MCSFRHSLIIESLFNFYSRKRIWKQTRMSCLLKQNRVSEIESDVWMDPPLYLRTVWRSKDWKRMHVEAEMKAIVEVKWKRILDLIFRLNSKEREIWSPISYIRFDSNLRSLWENAQLLLRYRILRNVKWPSMFASRMRSVISLISCLIACTVVHQVTLQ